MDPEIAEFARSFRTLANGGEPAGCPRTTTSCSEVGQHVQDFLGVPLNEVEPVTETFPPHQVLDVDVALEALLTEHGGDAARHQRQPPQPHRDLRTSFLYRGMRFGLGAGRVRAARRADRTATGGWSSSGCGEIRIDGVPLVWLQRARTRSTAASATASS